jgi:hypothetical protein
LIFHQKQTLNLKIVQRCLEMVDELEMYVSTYLYNGEGSGRGVERISWEDLPMVEDALRERLSASVRAKIGGETERLVHGQVGFDDEHRSAGDLLFFEHVTTPSVQDAVDTTDGDFRTLNNITANCQIDHLRCRDVALTWISHW